AGYAFRAWPVRVAVISAVAAVAVLAFVVVDRYPQVGQGAGTPLYVGLTVLLLSAYVVATYTLTRVDRVAATWGLVAGVLGAALLTLGMPAGGTYHVSGPLLLVYGAGLVAAFAGPPAVVAALVTRRDRSVQRGILAGAATGMYAALANLVGVLVLVMALPGRVPMDSDVLALHHTAADILGANVGEDLAVYVALLLGWPVVAVVLATAASSLASLRTPPRAAGSSAHSGTR
ncbi:MAG TPA: hypothetical protein VKB69_06135, partial [Micromonosporaceae bacterium]|nr:hypothetical protein [Micromonosporaceae bacterium]